jgi:hypothetical protein
MVGNANSGDGCDDCFVEYGWYCPLEGGACKTECGDKIKMGIEVSDFCGLDIYTYIKYVFS